MAKVFPTSTMFLIVPYIEDAADKKIENATAKMTAIPIKKSRDVNSNGRKT